MRRRPPNTVVRTCVVEGCGKKHAAKDFCEMHYRRWRRHGDPFCVLPSRVSTRVCDMAGCLREHYARGFCEMHYNRWKRHGDPLCVKSRVRLPKEAA